MVIHRKEIEKRLRRRTDEADALVITPLPESAVGSDSVDLRLGTYFLVSRSDRLPANVPGHGKGEHQRAIHVPLGRYLVVPGHQTVLASTLEYLKLPPDLSAMVLTKSSWARTFITVESAPWVHPCFRGCLTLEIANVSETPVLLYPGVQIAQLILMAGAGLESGDSKDRFEGTYLGPIKPEAASLRKPEETLAKLGIRRERVQLPWSKEPT